MKMKRLVATILTSVMIFAISVPGYAATIALQNISLEKQAFIMTVGDVEKVPQVHYYPANTTYSKIVSWTCDRPDIAMVMSDGTIFARKEGLATVQAKCGTVSQKFYVAVMPANQNGRTEKPIRSVSIPDHLSIKTGETITIPYSLFPADTTFLTDISWGYSSNNCADITINGHGSYWNQNASITLFGRKKGTDYLNGTATIYDSARTKIASIPFSVTVNVTGDPIPLTGIEFNESRMILTGFQHVRPDISFIPANTTDSKDFILSSSDSNVAFIYNGEIYADAPGTATITAICGMKRATCQIMVPDPNAKIPYEADESDIEDGEDDEGEDDEFGEEDEEDFDFGDLDYEDDEEEEDLDFEEDEEDDEDETDGDFDSIFFSEKTDVKKQAKLSVKLSKTKFFYNGKVQKPKVSVQLGKTILKKTQYTVTYAKGCKKPGTYKVTVKLKGKNKGSKTLTFKILKKVPIKKVTLNKTKLSLKVGETCTLKAVISPKNTTDSKKAVWASGNKKIATVVNGKVTAKKPGSTVITVKIGSRKVTCKVKVTAPKKKK